jgi:hypothetical protein
MPTMPTGQRYTALLNVRTALKGQGASYSPKQTAILLNMLRARPQAAIST